jgi:hypothetical protein
MSWPSLDEWGDALLVAADELATWLGLGGCNVVARVEGVSPDLPGAWIDLRGTSASLTLALLSYPEAGSLLARSMLSLGADDALAAEDIEDCVREMANILAGRVKREMEARDATLTLGIPWFSEAQSALPAAVAHVRLGDVPATVVLTLGRRDDSAGS